MAGMCVEATPLEDHTRAWGLYVKREDLSCPGGPNFSKTRGVYAHIAAQPARLIGVLDTSHSQGGWAVARACQVLRKECVVFYPVFKRPRPLGESQQQAYRLGAALRSLPAGRSAILFHRARKLLVEAREYTHTIEGEPRTAYLMPNALKLPEMITETAAEARRTPIPPTVRRILVSASSGTIAAGVIRAYQELGFEGEFIVHMGYNRPEGALRQYMDRITGGINQDRVRVVDEGYSYADRARAGPTPSWPCNNYYDLKAFRWWVGHGRADYVAGDMMFWNIG